MLSRLSKFLKSRWFNYSVVVALVALLISFLVPQYEEFQARAREMEVISMLNAVGAALGAIQDEFGNNTNNPYYPKKLEDAGFDPGPSSHYQYYANAEEIEAALRARIPQEHLPYMKGRDFQILAVGSPRGDKLEFWTLRPNKEIRKIKFSLPIDGQQ